VTTGEVFPERIPDEALPLWENLDGCPFFEKAPVRTPHWEEARRLMSRCKEAGQKLHLADALHVVMGSVVRAQAIWTTEISLVNKSKSGLLGPVPVCFPRIDQPLLPFQSE